MHLRILQDKSTMSKEYSPTETLVRDIKIKIDNVANQQKIIQLADEIANVFGKCAKDAKIAGALADADTGILPPLDGVHDVLKDAFERAKNRGVVGKAMSVLYDISDISTSIPMRGCAMERLSYLDVWNLLFHVLPASDEYLVMAKSISLSFACREYFSDPGTAKLAEKLAKMVEMANESEIGRALAEIEM